MTNITTDHLYNSNTTIQIALIMIKLSSGIYSRLIILLFQYATHPVTTHHPNLRGAAGCPRRRHV